MKRLKFTKRQIMSILIQNESGILVQDICSEHRISSANFYKWRWKFGGMDMPLMKRDK